jgi:hypothetical protein
MPRRNSCRNYPANPPQFFRRNYCRNSRRRRRRARYGGRMTSNASTCEAKATRFTALIGRPGSEASEVAAVDILGPVGIVMTEPEPGELPPADALAPPPGPITLTLTVTARRIEFATVLHPLDARLLALTEAMPGPQAEAVRAALAAMGEAWRGDGIAPGLDRALTVIERSARRLRGLLV